MKTTDAAAVVASLRIVKACEDVAQAETQLEQALLRRDAEMIAAHEHLSYNEIVAATDPATNGGHDTRKLSRQRVIQIVQPASKKRHAK